jgi:hypothetical protein
MANRGLVQHDSGELEDTGVSPVGVSPGDPWVNLAQQGVLDNTPNGQRDGEKQINGGQSNETPVIAVSQVAAGSNEIFALLPSPRDCANGED